MSNTSLVKSILTAATTAAAIYTISTGDISLPSKYYGDLPISTSKVTYEWDNYGLTPYYSVRTFESEIFNQIEVLHKFASTILEKSENLDSSFAKIINDNFSKLI
jgi:hypothetical protein